MRPEITLFSAEIRLFCGVFLPHEMRKEASIIKGNRFFNPGFKGDSMIIKKKRGGRKKTRFRLSL